MQTRTMSSAKMERMTSLRILVISLALYHLIAYCHAVPSESSESMGEVKARSLSVLSKVDQIMINGDEPLQEARSQRMDIEINDYPGMGPNDRHTPKPPE